MTNEVNDASLEAVEGTRFPELTTPAEPWWSGLAPPTIYATHPETGEYVSQALADPSPLEEGVWLVPALAYLDSPPDVMPGWARIRQGGKWRQVEDHRGKTVYSTETRESVIWSDLGALPAGWTLQAPATEFDDWVDKKWQVDKAAQSAALMQRASQKKGLLLQYAAGQLSILQDAVDQKMATDDEAKALAAWKSYRVLVNRVEVDTSAPASNSWPDAPNPIAIERWLTGQGYEDLAPA